MLIGLGNIVLERWGLIIESKVMIRLIKMIGIDEFAAGVFRFQESNPIVDGIQRFYLCLACQRLCMG